jgi:hypothetical protein
MQAYNLFNPFGPNAQNHYSRITKSFSPFVKGDSGGFKKRK